MLDVLTGLRLCVKCEGAFFICKTCDERGLCECYECNRMKNVLFLFLVDK